MTARWLLGAVAAGLLLTLAALAAEPVAAWFRLPRRWIWAAAMAGSLLLPAVALVAPGALPRLPLPRIASRPDVSAARVQTPLPGEILPDAAQPFAPDGGTLPAAFVLAWLAASLATVGTFAWAARRVRRTCGDCVPRRVEKTPVLVSERAGPMVLGVLDPQIVLPRWVLDAPEECRMILRHEREHLRGGDVWLLALASLAIALLPWSPALWWQHRRLRLAVETDCDGRVLAAGVSRRHYGRMLLDAAARPSSFAAPTLAWGGNPSHLERRIIAMTAPRPSHRVLRALPLACIAGVVAAAACSVAADGRDTPSATAADTRTHTERVDGKTVTTTRMADGSTKITMEDPRLAFTGFAWNYEPIAVEAGQPMPKVARRYPRVARVITGSNADRAGIQVGDVILASNGRDGREIPLLRDRRPGAEYDLRVRRDGRVRDVHVVLGPAPEAESR